MGILTLLTNPTNFKFYSDKGYVGNGETSGMKSYRFGQDRPGGGSSNQPYIKNLIDRPNTPALNSDFLLRGGISAPLNALEDVARLTKYFFDFKNPSGLLFTAKQNLLSRIGTKTEASKGLGYAGGALNEGVYTPLSTLAEAGIVWAGGHINKQGLDPFQDLFPNDFGDSATIKRYGDVATENNKEITNHAPPTVPESLYRKEDRANLREGNRIKATEKQIDKTTHEVKYRPKTQVNLPDIGDVFSADKNKFSSNKLENKINTFLQKWDTYRDDQAGKRLNRKEQREGVAHERALTATENRIEGEFYSQNVAREVYSNRLLNLWDTKGLNLSYPAIGSDPILYSYGGGPNSILGIGNTDIRFATSNTGEILRTGINMVNPYVQYGRRLVEYKTTNIFGKTFMPNSYGSVSLTYAGRYKTTTTEEELFGISDYLVSYNNTANIQPFDPNNIWFNSTNNFATWDQLNLNAQVLNRDSDTKEDFRNQLYISDNFNNTFLSLSPSYTRYMMESDFTSTSANSTGYGRIGLRSPGQKGDRSNYIRGKKDLLGNYKPIDFINALPIYKSSGVTGKDEYKNDLIKFRIAILDNDTQQKYFIHFRAFLNSFADSYGADWKSLEYMGRGEKFFKYSGFSRDISLSFTVAALSKQELIPMYKKLNFLASSLAPSYSSKGYLRGNIAYLTVGAWCFELPGVINSLDYDVPKEAPWEISISLKNNEGNGVGSQFNDDTVREVPHMIEVTMKFTPIHTFRPEIMSIKSTKDINNDSNPLKDGNIYGKQRYISLVNPYNEIKSNPDDVIIVSEEETMVEFDDGSLIPITSLVNENTINYTAQPSVGDSNFNPDVILGNPGDLVF
jgi:hypothetical protein